MSYPFPFLNPGYYSTPGRPATGVDSRNRQTAQPVQATSEGLLKSFPFEKPKYRNCNGTKRDTPLVYGQEAAPFNPSFVPTSKYKPDQFLLNNETVRMPPKCIAANDIMLVAAVQNAKTRDQAVEHPVGTIDTIKAYGDRLTEERLNLRVKELVDAGHRVEHVMAAFDKLKVEHARNLLQKPLAVRKNMYSLGRINGEAARAIPA